jgi:hypothetical protein
MVIYLWIVGFRDYLHLEIYVFLQSKCHCVDVEEGNLYWKESRK